MATKELSQVKSGKRNAYLVSWGERAGTVYVKRMGAFLSTWEKCDAKAKSARDAMLYLAAA